MGIGPRGYKEEFDAVLNKLDAISKKLEETQKTLKTKMENDNERWKKLEALIVQQLGKQKI